MFNSNKKRNILMAVLLAIVLLVSSFNGAAALDVPDHTDKFYVNDFAGLLSNETRSYIVKTVCLNWCPGSCNNNQIFTG